MLARICAGLLVAQLLALGFATAAILWSMRARMLELLGGLARVHTALLANAVSADAATAVAQRMTQVTASLQKSLRVVQGGKESAPPSRRPRREPGETLPSGALPEPDARPSRP
jgi:hypothetical protein